MTIYDDGEEKIYVGIAATAHMTSNLGILHSISPYQGNMKVYTSDGTTLPITHTGTTSIGPIKLIRPIKLNDMLVIPKLKKIFSLSINSLKIMFVYLSSHLLVF